MKITFKILEAKTNFEAPKAEAKMAWNKLWCCKSMFICLIKHTIIFCSTSCTKYISFFVLSLFISFDYPPKLAIERIVFLLPEKKKLQFATCPPGNDNTGAADGVSGEETSSWRLCSRTHRGLSTLSWTSTPHMNVGGVNCNPVPNRHLLYPLPPHIDR